MRTIILTLAALALVLPILVTGCDEEPTVQTATTPTATTSTAPAYQRQALSFYRGIDEPRYDAWQDLALDADRLRQDYFNTVTLSPPILITERAGGKPRVILEGEAGAVPGVVDRIHNAGMAVFITPTTVQAGFPPQIEPTESVLSQLTDDAIRWAGTAEEKQVELFSPLDEYNLVLGNDAANKWSAQVVPMLREKFHGGLVAKVVPDVDAPPAAGAPHDFEKLDYTGYDYLMLDVYPRGDTFSQDQFDAELADLLTRAEAVRARFGLKGVLLESGAWREAAGVDTVDGPLLGDDGQALLAGHVLQLGAPRVAGIFWHGWTLPGRGARGYKSEDALKLGFAAGRV